MSGWIRLHRQIWENPLYFKERFTQSAAWIDLLLLANHQPSIIRIRGNDGEVGRGQIARAMETLGKRWNWNRKTVGRYLNELEKWGMITQQRSHVITVITVNNYESYQSDGHQNTQQSTQQSGQQKSDRRDTYKKNKNVKNDKNENNNMWFSEIVRFLGKGNKVRNPEGYVAKLISEAGDAAVRKAWGEWQRGVLLNSNDFYSRALFIAKNPENG